MPLENIVVQGAREHNLKNVDVTIPRNKLIVITGVSGSGKSSLAFDTIYAEGQRRYVESLSAYARQFLGRMDKPDVDYIGGLSPAISIDQKGVSHNPRSTVGTVTEIYDYLRLLFARVGRPHCYKCGRPVERQTVQQIVDAVTSLPDGGRIQIMAPMVRRKKGEHKPVFEQARVAGFVRVRVNGETYEVSEVPDLDKKKWHTIEVVVDPFPLLARMRLRKSTEEVALLQRAVDITGVGLAAAIGATQPGMYEYEVKGVLHEDVHIAALKVVVAGLRRLGVLSGRTDRLIRENAHRPYFMHGTSHWLGLDVHDVGSYRDGDGPVTLAPGMVITVEPGIYFGEGVKAPRRLRGIGVRIEDDILVTRDGHRNLSAAIPSDPDELEALVGLDA